MNLIHVKLFIYHLSNNNQKHLIITMFNRFEIGQYEFINTDFITINH